MHLGDGGSASATPRKVSPETATGYAVARDGRPEVARQHVERAKLVLKSRVNDGRGRRWQHDASLASVRSRFQGRRSSRPGTSTQDTPDGNRPRATREGGVKKLPGGQPRL